MPAIKLIVGLGNPGRKYEQTRHNVGFLVVDRLAAAYGAALAGHLKWRAHVAKVPGAGVIMMKPQTFMNESGQSVGAALRFYKWQPENVLVVFDDVSLPFGALRFRMAGRLKIGIGNQTANSLTGHVLGKFSSAEQNELENTLATAAEAVKLALSEGVESAANSFNIKKSN